VHVQELVEEVVVYGRHTGMARRTTRINSVVAVDTGSGYAAHGRGRTAADTPTAGGFWSPTPYGRP
jgi:hypothetical protein